MKLFPHRYDTPSLLLLVSHRSARGGGGLEIIGETGDGHEELRPKQRRAHSALPKTTAPADTSNRLEGKGRGAWVVQLLSVCL